MISSTVRGFVLSSSQIEIVKWLAFALMVMDHVNKALLGGAMPYWTELARVVFPLFVVALAVSLRDVEPEKGFRVVGRMLLIGAISQPIASYLWGWSLLNIMCTLALGTAASLVWRYMDRFTGVCALVAACVLGFYCEYGAFGVLLIFAAFQFVRAPSEWTLVGFGVALIALSIPNGGLYWAVLTVPLLFIIAEVPVAVPRARHVFYWLYPVHLAVIAAVAAL